MNLPRLDGLHVLFVDDRRDARYVVDHLLRDAGARVTLLENGQQALEKVTAAPPGRSGAFDVVVLDMAMPVMDGLEATRILRQRGYDLPILALTAGVMEEDREECLAAGCDDYLRKPIDGIQLIQRVRTLADGACATYDS